MLKALLAGAAALSIAAAANAETYAIQAGHLIVDAAQPERGNSTVIVENGRIARIDNGFTAPAGRDRRRRAQPHGHAGHDRRPRPSDRNSGEPWYIGFTQKYSSALCGDRRT